jgi:ADP-ribose pyrophosphatase YjhB (NUDIX family)
LYNLPYGNILTESVDQAAARLLTERTQIKELHLNQFKVFGKTNRIISSPHRELIIKEIRNTKKNEVDWITSRFICVGYYPQLLFQK